MSQEHANRLEEWFSGLPTLVQETLHAPFAWMNEGLKAISGDPDALTSVAGDYFQIANSVSLVAREQIRDRSVLAGHWHGAAHNSFERQLTNIDGQLNELKLAIEQVPVLQPQIMKMFRYGWFQIRSGGGSRSPRRP